MVRGYAAFALVALMVGAAVIPFGAAHHCVSKINVYGRVLVAPLVPPPYTSATHSVCVDIMNVGGVDEHSLPPNTDQVFVRVNGDFGQGVQQLRITLDGLGFVSNDHYVFRTANQGGGYTYNLPDWLQLPDGPVDGTLTVTAHYPGNVIYSVTYRTTATVLPPPPPTPPTLPPP